jgi:hypothetical protein
MELQITVELKTVWTQTLAQLSGAARRMFMASVVKGLGWGGARQAQLQVGWDRTTVLKGPHELNSGIVCVDAVAQRGRKPLEAKLRNLAANLRAMREATCQTDPTFRTTQLYRRLTAGEARRRLIEELGYDPATVPSERSLRRKLSALGCKPRGWPGASPCAKCRKPTRSSKRCSASIARRTRTPARFVCLWIPRPWCPSGS